ncbi:MAG: hypothetical protein ACRDK4_00115 [Solirubrobacteraceae bacterium]
MSPTATDDTNGIFAMFRSGLNIPYECVEYPLVLATTVAHTTVQTVSSPDVIVAIVGGTMLALALSRPQLRWMEQLTKDSSLARLWSERALTLFAFVMGGYAWTCLFVVLHKQLGHEIDVMLRGAALFMIAYAWLVHFQPFVREWRLRGWLGATILYTGIATFAASIGVVIADTMLLSSFTLERISFLSITGGLACAGWLVYRSLPGLEAWLDRSAAHTTATGAGDSGRG